MNEFEILNLSKNFKLKVMSHLNTPKSGDYRDKISSNKPQNHKTKIKYIFRFSKPN